MQTLLSLLFGFASSIFLTAAFPTNDTSMLGLRTAQGISEDSLNAAKRQYPGVYWEEAARTCSQPQFDILVEATRMGSIFSQYHMSEINSPGWAKFFLSSQSWEGEHIGVYWKMRDLQRTLPSWVFKDPDYRNRRQYKISYTCGDPPDYTRCKEANIPAYTLKIPTRLENCPRCRTIVLCPTMWDTSRIRYANDIIAKPHDEGELSSLMTYEHVLVHEWTHNWGWNLGGVTDLKDEPYEGAGQQWIYGAYNCQKYAYKFAYVIGGSYTGINSKVPYNADNYAWMYSYNWFQSHYGWKGHAYGEVLSEDDHTRYTPSNETTWRSVSTMTDDGKVPPYCNTEDGCQSAAPGFYSNGNCVLSVQCWNEQYAPNKDDPECQCTCNGKDTPKSDPACASPWR